MSSKARANSSHAFSHSLARAAAPPPQSSVVVAIRARECVNLRRKSAALLQRVASVRNVQLAVQLCRGYHCRYTTSSKNTSGAPRSSFSLMLQRFRSLRFLSLCPRYFKRAGRRRGGPPAGPRCSARGGRPVTRNRAALFISFLSRRCALNARCIPSCEEVGRLMAGAAFVFRDEEKEHP